MGKGKINHCLISMALNLMLLINFKKCEMECNVCSLPVAKGPCHGNIIRWYFDSRSKECHAFKYDEDFTITF